MKEEGPAKILEGRYTKDAHVFIAPDSPEGKLLARGWRSVPALLESVGADLPPRMKAKVFALILGMTGGPTEAWSLSGVLGDWEHRSAGWAIQFEGGAGGFSPGSTSRGEGTISEKAQEAYARTWKEWAKSLKIELRD